MTDEDAIQQLMNGDLSGLEVLILRYQEKAVRVVFLIVQDLPLAEDIVVDTFLHIARRIRSFNPQQPFRPYLMRSLVNAALNATRRQNFSIDGEDASLQLEKLLTQDEPVEETVETAELHREIMSAIQSLPPRERAVIVQRYYLEMSEKEMSVALEMPNGTVKWLLNKARKNLSKLLSSTRSE